MPGVMTKEEFEALSPWDRGYYVYACVCKTNKRVKSRSRWWNDKQCSHAKRKKCGMYECEL